MRKTPLSDELASKFYQEYLRTLSAEDAELLEMVFAREAVISQLYPFYRDTLILCLYRDLEQKISDLYERIIDHTHEIFGTEITSVGGSHDVLFFF